MGNGWVCSFIVPQSALMALLCKIPYIAKFEHCSAFGSVIHCWILKLYSTFTVLYYSTTLHGRTDGRTDGA